MKDYPFTKYLNYTPLFTIALRLPYFNKVAYSLKLEGIKVGNSLLPITKSVFLPDHTGAGLLGNPMGDNFVFQGALDLCYQQPVSASFPQMLSPVTLMFDSAQITVDGHQLLYQIPKSSISINNFFLSA